MCGDVGPGSSPEASTQISKGFYADDATLNGADKIIVEPMSPFFCVGAHAKKRERRMLVAAFSHNKQRRKAFFFFVSSQDTIYESCVCCQR